MHICNKISNIDKQNKINLDKLADLRHFWMTRLLVVYEGIVPLTV